VEAGGLVGGGGAVSFTRSYVNGAGTAVGKGAASYDASAVWARLGWIWDADKSDQLGAFVEVEGLRQAVGGYVEPLSNANPFEAHVLAGSDSMTIARLGLRFNHASDHGWEYGGGLTVSRALSQTESLQAAIPGFGPVPAGAIADQTWAEFGARAGYSFGPRSNLSLFVTAVQGSSVIGGYAHGGLDYRVTF
ncbi:MAG: autotransporter outer membrane beta-barrel domain-containing protein, partial [Caulobacterales bacterium]